jgi:hypothetical protein
MLPLTIFPILRLVDQMRDDDSRVVLDGKGRDLLADERLKKAYLGL